MYIIYNNICKYINNWTSGNFKRIYVLRYKIVNLNSILQFIHIFVLGEIRYCTLFTGKVIVVVFITTNGFNSIYIYRMTFFINASANICNCLVFFFRKLFARRILYFFIVLIFSNPVPYLLLLYRRLIFKRQPMTSNRYEFSRNIFLI